MKANYINFDRHAIFNEEDLSLVLDLIQNTKSANLKNQLFGLFDGYLYNDFLDHARIDFGQERLAKLDILIEKIKTIRKFDLDKFTDISQDILDGVRDITWKKSENATLRLNVDDQFESEPFGENEKIQFYFVNDLYVVRLRLTDELFVDINVSDEEIEDNF